MESQTGSGESRSLHRALDILEFLARNGRPVTLAEITDAVESPKATLHRLLATLQSRGYVSQEPRTGRYAAGIRCFELGSMWAQQLDLRMVAAPLLAELNERTGEMVHLAVYEHGDVVYVDKLESSQPIAPRSYVGRRCPAYCVSTGRALLAYMPADEIERVLAEPLPSYTERTLTDPDGLLALLEDVRRTGFATNDGSYRDGVCGIAAPIRDHTGGVVASVGCCLPESRFGGERLDLLRDATLAAAEGISGRLGWVVAEGITTGGRRPGP
jgi:DNA-binding IclR family transcriptional regulator